MNVFQRTACSDQQSSDTLKGNFVAGLWVAFFPFYFKYQDPKKPIVITRKQNTKSLPQFMTL